MDKRVENKALKKLIGLFTLEKLSDCRFRGQSQDLGYGRVFGGQILGQALSAAYQTVAPGRRANSMHAYFIKQGDPKKPIDYVVDSIGDGNSFTRRRIVAVQEKCEILFMTASFQIEESGYEYYDKAPAVIGPEGIESELELAEKIKHKIPGALRERVLYRKAIEMRPVDPINPISPEKREPKRYIWMKAIGEVPDDIRVNHSLLAYSSDFNLGLTALYPHGHSFWEPEIQIASLDHAIWFHRDHRVDQWFLHAMENTNACRARGLNHGKIYSREGILIASVAQEALFRYNKLKTW